MYFYPSRRKDVAPLRLRLRKHAEARRRYVYRSLTVPLQREGWPSFPEERYRRAKFHYGQGTVNRLSRC